MEKILKDAAESSQSESFMESGPQAVTQVCSSIISCPLFQPYFQVIIMISTGQVTSVQLFSVSASIINLSFGAARVFFVQRNSDKADPDPDSSTLILRVWPYTFVKTIANLLLWVIIGSFQGVYTTISLLGNFLTVLVVLKVQDLIGAAGSRLGEEEDKRKTFPPVQASLFAVWIPCVPGHNKHVFWTAAITSLVTKLGILGLAIGLYSAGYQDRIHPNHSFLLCVNHLKLDGDLAPCSVSSDHLNSGTPPCFHSQMSNQSYINRMSKMSQLYESLTTLKEAHEKYEQQVVGWNDTNFELPDVLTKVKSLMTKTKKSLHKAGIDGMQQKKRICSPNENELRYYFLAASLVIILFSLYADWQLSSISDYKTLFDRSAKLLWCIPTPGFRVIHR